jgi:restriction endonuclease S subunit
MDKLPKSWKTLKIKEACIFRPAKKEVSKLKDIQVSFVPMATVKERRMFFNNSEVKDIQEVYKGYTYFQNNDVLLAKVTPCFENGKSAIARNLKNGIGFGSSEFYVLRPNEGILPEWIYRNISNSDFLLLGKNHMSGAVGLKRLTQDFLLNFKIPIPPLPEQKHIVSKLDALFERIDKSIALLEENIKQTSLLVSSSLDGIFDNLSEKYPIEPLLKYVDFIGGSQPPKTNFSYEKKPGYVRLIQIRDYKSDNYVVYINEKSTKKFCDADDVMIGRYGPPVFQILRGLKGAYNVALMKAVPDEKVVSKDFLFYFLQNGKIQNYIISISQRSAGQSGVNKKALELYDMVIPPLDIQNKTVKKIKNLQDSLSQLQTEQKDKLSNLNALKESILDKAFKGEL